MNFQKISVNGVSCRLLRILLINQFNRFVSGPFVGKRHLKLVKPFSDQFPFLTLGGFSIDDGYGSENVSFKMN